MALTCTAGLIAVQDIIDAVNENETGITTNESNITQNRNDIDSNDVELSDHASRIISLENNSVTNGDIAALEGRVTVNETNIGTNTGDITTNTADIVTNTNDIAGLDTRVGINEADIATNAQNISTLTTSVGNQATDIATNRTDIDTLLAGNGLGGEAIYGHKELAGVDGGSSTAGTWTPRNIETEALNDIGAVGGATSITLDAGTYDLEVHAVVVGSASQTRINVGGTEFIYGFSLNSEGLSQAIGRVTLAVPTVVSIETNVDVGVAGSGFGLSNTFTTDNVYVTFHIEKVG